MLQLCNEQVFSSVIFCEAVAIYGVIVAIILQTKLESVPSSKMYDAESLRAGYAIFASGIIVGFANLVCGSVSSSSSSGTLQALLTPKSHCLCYGDLLLQIMCRNHWKQLRLVWCSELNALCQDSCYWDLWECTRVIWSYRRDHYVSTSDMAYKVKICKLVTYGLVPNTFYDLFSKSGKNYTSLFVYLLYLFM